MKILDAIWFTPLGGQMVGIVIGVDKVTGEHKAYIGTAGGEDETFDAEYIASHGAKFHLMIAERIIRALKGGI